MDMKVDSGNSDTGSDFSTGNAGEDNQLKSDLQSSDKRTQGAAMQDLVKMILDALKEAKGSEGEGSTGGGSGGGGSTDSASGDAPQSLEDLIKQAAEEFGLSPEQAEQLSKDVNSAMEDQGIEKPSETTT